MASAEVSAQSDVPPAAAGPELPRLGAAAGGMPCYDAQSGAALVAYLRGRAAAAPAAVEGDGGDGVDVSAAAGGGAAQAGAPARAASRRECPGWVKRAVPDGPARSRLLHSLSVNGAGQVVDSTHSLALLEKVANAADSVCNPPPFPFHFAAAAALAAIFSAAYFFICACSASHAAAPPGKVAFIACMAPSSPLKERCDSVQCFHTKVSFRFQVRMTGSTSFLKQSSQ